MILIADSGSTKTDWAILDKNSPTQYFQTAGFNPHVVDRNFIVSELYLNSHIKSVVKKVSIVYFYGAGCSSDEMQGVVQSALDLVFTNSKNQVHHDLLGAARAVWQDEPCFVNILGTGSNCCYFNGNKITQKKPSLGYLLGDEGSGKDLGGRLFKAVLYENTPPSIRNQFLEEFNPEGKNLIDELYRQNRPNRYLASFVPFLKKNIQNEYVRKLVETCFLDFIQVHIKSYDNLKSIPSGFVGSIAWHFQDVLKEILEREGLKLGKIVQKPIEGLVEFHSK